jgi:hypothetical protein
MRASPTLATASITLVLAAGAGLDGTATLPTIAAILAAAAGTGAAAYTTRRRPPMAYYQTTGPRKPNPDGRGLQPYGRRHISRDTGNSLAPLCGTTEEQAPMHGPFDAEAALDSMVRVPGRWRCDTCWDESVREKHPQLRGRIR